MNIKNNLMIKDLYYSLYNTPVCPLLYVHDSQGTLFSTEWLTDEKYKDRELPQMRWPQLEKELDSYFKGEKPSFSFNVTFDNLTDFTKKVLNAMINIPYGKVMTYKEMADKIKAPKAVRAVGQACKRNPYPLIIPCHRVVSQTGLGGYSGQTGSGDKIDIKRSLLQLEGYL